MDLPCWCNNECESWTVVSVVGAYVLTLYADTSILLFCLYWRAWARIHLMFLIFSFLALWAHVKTMLTDPGAVPPDAQPINADFNPGFCHRCNAYKPKTAYHCSRCRRCVVRMDHHCPYMNNCIGVGNQKHMILFLIYCVAQAVYALLLCLYYGFRSFGFVTYAPPRRIVALFLAMDGIVTLGFTGTMLHRQYVSLTTGIGTIDRLKQAKGKRIAGGMPRPLTLVFGSNFLLWPFPFDPDLDDAPDWLFGYRVPAHLTTPTTPLLS